MKKITEKHLYKALWDLWLDLNDTGEDRNAETGKEYKTAKAARIILERYRRENKIIGGN